MLLLCVGVGTAAGLGGPATAATADSGRGADQVVPAASTDGAAVPGADTSTSTSAAVATQPPADSGTTSAGDTSSPAGSAGSGGGTPPGAGSPTGGGGSGTPAGPATGGGTTSAGPSTDTGGPTTPPTSITPTPPHADPAPTPTDTTTPTVTPTPACSAPAADGASGTCPSDPAPCPTGRSAGSDGICSPGPTACPAATPAPGTTTGNQCAPSPTCPSTMPAGHGVAVAVRATDCPTPCPTLTAGSSARTGSECRPTCTAAAAGSDCGSPTCPSATPAWPYFPESASPCTVSPTATEPGTNQGTPREQTVTCPDGSVRSSVDQCLPPQRYCAGSPVSVPVGQACPPPPRPEPPVPVICWDGSQHAATADCPAGRLMCPGGASVELDQQCPVSAPPRCVKGKVRVLGVCTPAQRPGDPAPPVGQPVAREARPGELLFDRTVVTAGDTLFARGAGCRPGAQVTLTASGELVGQAVADQAGTFETVVQFASFRPGYRPVEVRCGEELTAGIDMVLVSADTSASTSSVLLPLFLALSFLAVHYQMAARRRRRSRALRR
ncbi:hypothetical protein [Frankia sp. AgB32]|uniref:hypothetical protein n=1 Tax=Frankia sp. AgB32 TaxID=631119 RepID=UPI00200D14E9|nr:hypothetical protein [Frankia sp. AgB32]MCK9896210.1 hypothetical protein [Frankia sp. AgB32]